MEEEKVWYTFNTGLKEPPAQQVHRRWFCSSFSRRQVYSHDFSTGLHPAYAISHSGGLVFFSARSTHSDPFSTDFLLSSLLFSLFLSSFLVHESKTGGFDRDGYVGRLDLWGTSRCFRGESIVISVRFDR